LRRRLPQIEQGSERSPRDVTARRPSPVALHLGLDMTTPMGSAMAGVASVFGELERRLISQRTRDALAAKRADGVRLGRPRVVDADARARIVELRAAGGSWRDVATTMADEGWPTGHGG
jgi:DNA invertase Pin-like site-specific DNA recombinase